MMTQYKVVVIGSGFSGLCMGIKLRQLGIEDFLILEKSDTLGGTWRENTYPGCECDVPSALYSFSFFPNPEWARVWSSQEHIHDYQKRAVEHFKIGDKIEYGKAVVSAEFDQTKSVWKVTTKDGQAYIAQHVVCAVGQLHEVSTPTFTGADTFKGAVFHSAKWDHSVELKNKRIAVIGNAASAVQFVPEITDDAKSLTVFQRSPNWQLEKPNREYSRLEVYLSKKIPPLMKLYRLGLWLQGERILFPAIKSDGIARKLIRQQALNNLEKHVKDPVLREKLTPDYELGAKRVLFSHKYYEALSSDNVHLQTSAIKQITETGIVCEDGSSDEFDVIIYATGFITNPFVKSIDVKGENGKQLSEHWGDAGAHAYLGVHTNGFPNLHIMYGPNTNLGHNSIIFMIEAQTNYITEVITTLDAKGASAADVQSKAEASYNDQLQTALKKMSFAKVEKSWYMDKGKVTNNWSGSSGEYKKLLANVNWTDYLLSDHGSNPEHSN